MKKLLLLFFVALLSAMSMLAASADERNGIRVVTNQTKPSGEAECYEFHFAAKPILNYINEFENYVLTIRDISITSSNMQQTHGVAEILLHQDDVKSIDFITLSETGISNVFNKDFNVAIDGRQVSITGIGNGEAVKVYSADGKMLFSSCADRGKVSLQLPAASPGTLFIVKCGGGAFKLRIR